MRQKYALRLSTLLEFKRQIEFSLTLDELSRALTIHLQAARLAQQAFLLPSSTGNVDNASALIFRIPKTDYRLWVEPYEPYDDAARELLELYITILSVHGALYQENELVSEKQQQLLKYLEEKIAEQRGLETVLDYLALHFPAAFNHGAGRLVTFNSADEKVEVRRIFTCSSASATYFLESSRYVVGFVSNGETAVFPYEDRTELYLPLQYGGRTKAMLHFVQWDPIVISRSTLRALERLVGLLGIGLSNETLSLQAWQRANQLETVYRVTESTRSLQPLAVTLVEIHQQILRAFRAPICYIALVNKEKNRIDFPCVWVEGAPASWTSIPIQSNYHLTAWVVRNKVPFATDDWSMPEKPLQDSALPTGVRSVVAVPMQHGGEVLGALSIQHTSPFAFNASDYQTLVAIAAHAGIIIKNATLYADVREMVDMSTRNFQSAVSLRRALAAVNSSIDPQQVLEQLFAILPTVVKCERAYAVLLTNGRMTAVYSNDPRGQLTTVDKMAFKRAWGKHPWILQLVNTREFVEIKGEEIQAKWPDWETPDKIHSWFAVPLLAGKRLVGILIIESNFEDAFDINGEWTVSSLATHVGVAIQNARLFQQSQQQLLELGTLHQASATMTANLEQQAVLQTITTELANALQIESCTIFTWDHVMKTLIPTAHSKAMGTQARAEQTNLVGLSVVENLSENEVIRNLLETHQTKILRRDERTTPVEDVLLNASGLSAMMLVPLIRREKVVGLLTMGQIDEPVSYSESELKIVERLAGQAAIAIEHSKLYGQAQRRIDELSTFHEIVLKLNSPLKLNTVLDTITESALKLIDATNLHIFLYDQKTNEFTKGSALWRDGRRTAAVQKPRAEGKGLTATVVKHGQPVVINNAPEHPYFQSKDAQAWGIYAIAGFPLKYGDEVLGAFTATYLHPHVFTDDELLLLNLLAEQAAVAVRNAGLYSESQRRLRDMSALVDMAKQVTGDLNLMSVLQTTVQILRGLLNARACSITMVSSENGEDLILRAADGVNQEYLNTRMEINGTVSGQVLKSGKLVYIHDTTSKPDFIFFDDVVRSLLVVPLIIRDRVIGTLSVDSDQTKAFSDLDVQLMTIAAAQVSVAIANARLFEEVEARADELKVAYDVLKESDQLKDELVQNVSHELRTPLTFVKGYVDLLLDGEMGLMNDEQQDALTIIADKTNDITRIIDDIITLQKINSGNLKLEKTEMAAFLETAVAGHKMIASKKGLTIDFALPSQKGVVIIDRGRINQVLDNLIGNAMKFSPNGGTITVTMKQDDNSVTVAVKDEGIGISPEKHKKIFERFYQIDGSASRRFGGTGIGLAIVKRIIDAHNGKIWVESEEQRGSAFTFQLPKADSKRSAPNLVDTV